MNLLLICIAIILFLCFIAIIVYFTCFEHRLSPQTTSYLKNVRAYIKENQLTITDQTDIEILNEIISTFGTK